MQKNDELTLEITDTGIDGEGIGRADGIPFFVKDAVIGDLVKVKIVKMKKTYGYARLQEIIRPSEFRTEPRCALYRQCGGCQIQVLSYPKQLEFKQNKVENNLKRIGGFDHVPMEPIIGMEEPYQYRNKAQFPVGTDKSGNIVTGFYAGRSHHIVPTRDCPVGAPVNKAVLDAVVGFMEAFQIPAYEEETGTGLIRHILIRYGYCTGEIMVCLIINGTSVPESQNLIKRLCAIDGMTSITVNSNTARTNVILGKTTKLLWGKPYITDYIGTLKYQISPVSFFQINSVQTEKLYDVVKSYAGLTGTETVWDLYCGIGTISLYLAAGAAHVFGVEIIPEAIEDACRNAELNGISNAEFYVGKAEEVLPDYYRNEMAAGRKASADVIVLDPPRKGCDKTLLDTVLAMSPDRIVYVSCDSATLARDLKVLCADDYRLEKVRAVDQFCHTVHVETVILMTRCGKNDK